MTQRKAQDKGPKKAPKRNAGKGKAAADALMRDLARRMEACPDAEALNDRVILPFVAALESVCGARGYLLNIYGETSNIVFTGDEADAEAIYELVEKYLDTAADA